MNFTREPIIETIISPRDGFKLLVRNSKGGGAEEYFVDALEVVSFGHAFFFRSLERPKSFLVPVSDYEVLEVKETRVALKNVSHERSIKIGGGREGPVRQHVKEPAPEKEIEVPDVAAGSEVASSETVADTPHRGDKRRDRRRHRRRRSPEDQEWTDRKPATSESEPDAARQESAAEGGGAIEETKVSSSMFSSLFPPPPTLISETLSRYKDKEFSFEPPHSKQTEKVKEAPEEEPKHPEPESSQKEEKHKEEDSSDSESTPLNRVAAGHESTDYMSTYFSPLNGSPGFDPYS